MALERLTVTFVALAVSAGALAQPYPAKPLKLVNGFPAGGGSDVLARFVATKLADLLGQPVVVEPRPGAGGSLAYDYVAKVAPDGYTLLLVTGAFPAMGAAVKSLPFDPIGSFSYISTLTFYPFTVSVNASTPHRSLAGFIAHARANPGKLNCSTSGVGTVPHLACELFNSVAGTEIVHIPFKGGAAPLTELLAGRSDVLFETMTFSLPHIRSGKIKALAVTSLAQSPALPEIPTAAQTLPGYEVNSFAGLATTAGTPPAIVERLHRDVQKLLESPDVRPRFIELGGEPKGSTPEAARDYVASEIAKWRKVMVDKKIEQQ